MADGYLNFDTKINTQGYDKGVQSLGNSLGGLKKGLLGIAAAAGAAFSVKVLVDFGKQAVSLASDLQEVQNVVDTAFGDMSHKMELFADTAIEMYGISKLTAKQTGSTFMAMASGMGIAAASASDMAVSLTGLSADMASFYNVAQDVSSTALKSIFTGETETLKQFGIVMTEANLQSFALSQGITKSLKAMTQAEKVQLRYNYVMAQTTLAQGDFAKTSGGWANQIRILSEQWKEFSTTIGQVLVQVLLPALNTLNSVMAKVVSWSQAAANSLTDLFGWQLDASSAAGSMSSSLSDCADDYAAMADSAEAAAAANERSLASFDEIHTIGSEESGIAGAGIGGLSSVNTLSDAVGSDTATAESEIDSFVAKIKAKWQEMTADIDFDVYTDWAEQINTKLSAGWENLTFGGDKIFESLQKAFVRNQPQIESAIKNLCTAFAQGGMTIGTVFADIWAGASRGFAEFTAQYQPEITRFYDNLLGVAAQTTDLVADVFHDLFDDLGGWWDEDGQRIWHDVVDMFKDIGGWCLKLWNNFAWPLIENLITELGTLWEQHLRPFAEKARGLFTSAFELFTTLYEQYIKPFVDRFIKNNVPSLRAAVEAMTDFFADGFGVIVDWFSVFTDSATGIIDFLTNAFQGDWEDAWQSVVDTFGEVKTDVGKVMVGIANMIIDALNFVIAGVYNALSDAINGVGDIVETFGDLIGQEWDVSVPSNPPQIPKFSLPKLATGTVVPAGFGEFAAILGDNKREPEIVSPESYMKQAFLDALQESGITSGGGTQIIKLVVDGRTLTEIVNRENQRSGRAGNGTR